MSRFLEFVVRKALDGEEDEIKEQIIGREVFDKPADYDTRLDPIVRVEARRLRTRLHDYYREHGADNPVVIRLNKGGYTPEFELAAQPSGEDSIDESEPGPPAADERAVAVLPFVDMSPQRDQQHFCEGLTEELINALTQTPGLQIVARSSSFQFQGPAHDVREVGERLAVGRVLEGSVRRQGSRVRVTAQLTDAATGFHLWSKTYDANVEDDFDAQEQISNQIVETLKSERDERSDHALKRARTDSADALRLYLQGLYLSRQFKGSDLVEAAERFAAATDEDPGYAEAYSGLALCWGSLAWLMESKPGDAWANAKAAANKAVEIDESNAPAHAALGCISCAGDWNFDAGEKSFRSAIELDSADYNAYNWYAVAALGPLGRIDEARRMIHTAAERSGFSLDAQNHVGLIHYYAREYEEAARVHIEALDRNPSFVQAYWDLARAAIARKDFEGADTALERAREISGGSPQVLAWIGVRQALTGRTEEARKAASDLVRLSRKNLYVSSLYIAQIYVALEDRDRAFEWFGKAVEERAPRLIELDVDSLYDSIRDDERFEELRRLVCLEPAPKAAA